MDMNKVMIVRVEAEDALWAVIVKRYPEIKTGDFPPDAWRLLHDAIGNAIVTWLDTNSPDTETQA